MPGPEWIWVILAIVVLFGASRLPIMGRNVGLGIKELKKGLAEATSDDDGLATQDGKPTASNERDRGTTA